MQIHNLRFGGQVSVQVNDDVWIPLYNETAQLHQMEERHDGIGGINATIRLTIPLERGVVQRGRENRVTIRLNATDQITTAVRVLQVNFEDAAGRSLVAPSAFIQEDSSTWRAPTPSPADLIKGEMLWKGQSKSLVNDPLSKAPIRGSCSSCHFDDGSDLKYFNFSNESIIARSRFHGLSYPRGRVHRELHSYKIRSLTSGPLGPALSARAWP